MRWTSDDSTWLVVIGYFFLLNYSQATLTQLAELSTIIAQCFTADVVALQRQLVVLYICVHSAISLMHNFDELAQRAHGSVKRLTLITAMRSDLPSVVTLSAILEIT